MTIDRTKFIGGSDAAAILGVSPWKTPHGLWLEKIGREEKRDDDPARERILRRGKRMEPVAIDMLAEEYGIEVTARSTEAEPIYYTDGAYDFLRAQIDFEWRVSQEIADVYDLDPALVGTVQNGEIKTVHPFAAGKYGEEGTDEVPVEYSAQAMHGMSVTGRQVTLVAVLVGADRLLLYFVKRDDALCNQIKHAEIRFWQENVRSLIAPDPVNMDDIKAMFLKPNGKPVEVTSTVLDQLRDLKAVRASIAQMKKDEEALEFAICANVCKAWGTDPETPPADNALLTLNGAQVGTWKRQRGTHLDQKALKEAAPEIVQKFTKEHQFRVLRIAKEA